MAEHLDINIIVDKYRRVSLQAYLRQPFRNLLHGRPRADLPATGRASPYQLGPRGYNAFRSSGMSGVGSKPDSRAAANSSAIFAVSLRLLTPRSDNCRLVLAPRKPYCHPTPGAIDYDRLERQQKRLVQKKAAGMTS
jgi:hypothetical protein